MSTRPMPAHHRTIRIPFAAVAKGYGGVRSIAGLKGPWIIVAACPTEDHPHEAADVAWVIVAPAKVAP